MVKLFGFAWNALKLFLNKHKALCLFLHYHVNKLAKMNKSPLMCVSVG